MALKVTKFRIGAAVFVLFLLNGLLSTAYYHLKSRLYNGRAPLGEIAINELGGAVLAAGLLGCLLYLFWKLPLRPLNWRGWLAAHSFAVVVYSLLHTTAYWGIRTLFYPLAGYGPYDPRDLRLRYAMEFPNDVLTYSKWLLLFLVFQYYQRLRDREVAASKLTHSLTQAKLKNLQAQMQPHFLMNALNGISSLI